MAAPDELYDVAIIGYGPVGATLGHLLGLSGVKTMILDREEAPYPLPRAVHFDDEVMRVFQAIGLAEQIEAVCRKNIGMQFIDKAGKLLLDWPRPQEIGRHGWYASYRFHQPDLENILRAAMPMRSSVAVLTGCNVTEVTVDGPECSLKYDQISTGKEGRIRAKYVVGCDGARSLTRQTMGSETQDYAFHERWLVVDVLLNRPKPELGDWTIQYCNPDRPATFVRGPQNRRRWEISLKDDEPSETMTNPSEIWRLLANWLAPDEAEIERAAVYTFHALVAKSWRQGRLMLAGDAAHQTPPFMGQGMCAGIRDVSNLAWKLALVVQGKSDALLLDSYQSERRPNAETYITTAVRLGGLINTAGTRAALEAAFPTPDGSARMQSIAPPLGPGLGQGPFAGQLFGQPVLADGQRMDRATGYRPALVVDQSLAQDLTLPDGLALVSSRNAPDVQAELDRLAVKAVLVRPDGYIQGTALDKNGTLALIAAALPSPTDPK